MDASGRAAAVDPASPGLGALDPIAAAAIAVAGPEAVAAVLAAAATIPPTDDPWLAPFAEAALPPELELPPRDPR